MPFDDCACHVFAITGYLNDENALLAHNAYAQLSGTLKKPGNEDARCENVKTLVELVRKAAGAVATKEPCIVYGGFRGRDSLGPEHMWVEWQGAIFDTMPNHPLRTAPANGSSRAQPPCENSKFDKVGFYRTFLTTAQLNNLKEQKTEKPVW